AAQMVDGDGRLREHAERAVADAEDETADPHAAGLARERRHGRDALERRLRRVRDVRDRVDVVPDRAPVEPLLVRDPPQAAKVADRTILRAGVDAEAHAPVYTRDARAGQTTPARRYATLREDGLHRLRAERVAQELDLLLRLAA